MSKVAVRRQHNANVYSLCPSLRKVSLDDVAVIC